MKIKITLNGTDITRDIEPYLKSFSYEDVLSGETDSIDIELADRAHLFLSDWFPPLAATISVTLIKEKEQIFLGDFELDEISYAMPPSTIKIKANSCPQKSALRQVNQSRAWENCLLSQIAKDIAADADAQLIYQTEYDPKISRAEQGSQSAMNFLEKLCAKYFLSLKFTDNQLVIFETETLEKAETVATLTPENVTHFNARSTLSEIYKSCEVSYRHGKKSENFTATAQDKSKTAGKVLKINKKVESVAEAERLAKNELKQKNKDELKVDVEVRGDFIYSAGMTIQLVNFGVFDGKYLIEKAKHEVRRGYECRLELRKTLEGNYD